MAARAWRASAPRAGAMSGSSRGVLSPRGALELARPSASPEADIRVLRAARECFLSGGHLAPALRPLIQRSWPRSARFGVSPAARRLDALAPPRLETRVQRAAAPILDELGRLVQTTRAAVILADADGVIVQVAGEPDVQRLLHAVYPVPGAMLSEDAAGTNAIGTAIEEGCGVQVWSGEHFIEAFQGFLCTAVPLRDPLSRKLLGVLDLTIRDRDVSPAVARTLARIVADASGKIERALAEQLAAREQALLYHYLRELRRRAPVIAFDGRTTIASNAALSLLVQDDLTAVLAYAEETLRTRRPVERAVRLRSGRVARLLASPRFDGGECVGTIVRLEAGAEETARAVLPPRPDPFRHLVGQSPAFRGALDLARAAVERGLAAYLHGEPGCGKYALARAIAAAWGGRCATVEGEEGGGRATRWSASLPRQLDGAEVVIVRHADALRGAAQRALLGALEGMQPVPRLLATGQRAAARSGLAPGLLQRLATLEIKLPPLRERREDIPPLVQQLVHALDAGQGARVSPAALQVLAQADWPGNVRQLERALQAALAVATGPEIGPRDLPEQIVAAGRRPKLSRLEEVELEELRHALREARGNRARAAALLGIGRSTLYRKLDGYRLKGFPLG